MADAQLALHAQPTAAEAVAAIRRCAGRLAERCRVWDEPFGVAEAIAIVEWVDVLEAAHDA